MSRKLLAALVLSAFAVLLLTVSCGDSGPKEPESIVEARKLLDDAWTTLGPSGKELVLRSLVQAPDLPFAEGKEEAIFDFASEQQRLDLARVLAEWDTDRVIPVFKKLLEDKSELIQLFAARVLAERGDESGKQILADHIRAADGSLHPENCGLLAKLGDDVCFELAKKELTSKDAMRSAAAAATLGEIGGPQAARVLRSRLANLHGDRRTPAITALSLVSEEPNDVPLVLSFFRYKENVLAVIDALGEMGGEKAIARLRKTLEVKDPLASSHAAAALVRLGQIDDEVKAAITAAAKSSSVRIRYDVVSLLALAPPSPEVAALIAQFARDEEPKVVLQALRGLEPQVTEAQWEDVLAAWENTKEATEGAGYEASMAAIAVIGRSPGSAPDEFLPTLFEMDWNHVVQAAVALVARYEREHPTPPAG